MTRGRRTSGARAPRGGSRVVTLNRRRSIRVAALVGVGLMAAIDQIVFHQLLGWHHFVDEASVHRGIAWDGVLHAVELVLLVSGLLLFSGLRRSGALAPRSAVGGLLVGMGGFQLWDGVVHHKILRLHQVRGGVDLLPYDLAWNAAALVLLGIGAALLLRSRGEGGTSGVPPR